MPQFCVYVYRDPSRNFQPIYVGKGQGRRAYDHLKTRDRPHKKENKSFIGRLRNMKDAGIEPIINVVDMPSEALAFQCEVDTIARLGRKDQGKGPLLNQTDGGEGTSGHIRTEETRKKQSDAMKGKSFSAEHCRNLSEANKGKSPPNKGKSTSTESRQKNSDAHKGKVLPMLTCPHCNKVGRTNGLKQWHFDKCKYKK